jgi:outer membrane protein assembly factor BamB
LAAAPVTPGNLVGGGTASTIHEFTTDGELIQKLVVSGQSGGTITAIAAESSASLLIGGTAGQVLRLSASGLVIDGFSIPVPGATVQSLAVEEGGTILAGGTAGQVLRLTPSGNVLEILTIPVPGQTVFSLAVEPSGTLLAGGTGGGIVRFGPTGDVIEQFAVDVPGATVLALAVGGDGRIYVGGTASTVIVTNPAGQLLGSFQISGFEGASVQSLALIPVPLPSAAVLLIAPLVLLTAGRRGSVGTSRAAA